MQFIFQFPAYAVLVSTLAYIMAVVVIVFFHELGHFLVGRWCGVKIEAFSIGFGRELAGFTDKHGTRWKLGWLPLGGYVKFEGDANGASLPDANAKVTETSLQGAKLWKRFLIVLAGPVANFILSIVIFAAAYSLVGMPISQPRVDEVVEDGAAKAAGLMAGDYIRKIDGTEIKSFGDIQDAMVLRQAAPVALVVERGGQNLDITLTPKIVEIEDGLGTKVKVTQIGIKHDARLDPEGTERLNPVAALGKGAERTWFVAGTTLHYIGKIFMGTESSSQLHGPFGVAKVAGDTASMGVWPFVFFIGLISVSIGLVNLFPIPMLDGGHLLFYLIEGVMGRPVSPVAQEWSFRIGLSAILMLMVLVTTNDIFTIFGH
ncbi:RIP metalloprotease RseP [Aestuariivirga litoralis]|uniref:RIP metalloprotease RseP n=1 Tax=Aestuariivirga litoralis TaxID=2650924 RepID=UPI0018C64C6C|nr:RIP metalloprotease RseP [Aestuariivirga litoralis]MBG1231728.1 RIP metalloprotease RseP [Aestuariivirga litoralis]